MTIRELQLHFDRGRDAGDEYMDDGNCLNMATVLIVA